MGNQQSSTPNVRNTTGGDNHIQFATSPADIPAQSATLSWNSGDGTLDLRMGYDAVIQQIGMEQYHPPAVNNTSATIPNGTIVMVDPAAPVQGNRPAIVLAVTDGTYAPQLIMGVTTMDIPKNQTGLVTWFGKVRSLVMADIKGNPLETWVDGDILYSSATVPGKFTNVRPAAPGLKMTIALVIRIDGVNIDILVRFVGFGSYMGGIHDATITSPVAGNSIVYSGTVWENKTLTAADMSYDNSTSGLTATTVQAAIDEIIARLTA